MAIADRPRARAFGWPPGAHLDWACVEASRRQRNRALRHLLLPYLVAGVPFGLAFLLDARERGVALAFTGMFVLLLAVATPWWVGHCLWALWCHQRDLDRGRRAFESRFGVDPLMVRPVRRGVDG